MVFQYVQRKESIVSSLLELLYAEGVIALLTPKEREAISTVLEHKITDSDINVLIQEAANVLDGWLILVGNDGIAYIETKVLDRIVYGRIRTTSASVSDLIPSYMKDWFAMHNGTGFIRPVH